MVEAATRYKGEANVESTNETAGEEGSSKIHTKLKNRICRIE
jgi:hypothetical protein